MPSSAQWRIDGGAWQNTSTELNISRSVAHDRLRGLRRLHHAGLRIDFAVSGRTPSRAAKTALASFSVALTPNNAEWRIDGGAWQNTFTTLNNLSLGAHAIDYSTIAGYITPDRSGHVREARQLADAQLHRVGVVEHRPTRTTRSGASMAATGRTRLRRCHLSLGLHTIDYSTISVTFTPASEPSRWSAADSLSHSYAPLASLAVTLTPITRSGASMARLAEHLHDAQQPLLGSHAIDYQRSPATHGPVGIGHAQQRQNLALTRSYTPLATLNIALTPTSGQWRNDAGRGRTRSPR